MGCGVVSPFDGVPVLSAGGAPPGSNRTGVCRTPCTLTAMSEATRLLHQIQQGDPHAARQLLPLVYDELRRLATHKLAQERPGQTLQATALVHEAYLRLVGHDPDQHWDHRGHFFAAAAEAMRRILVERARRKRRRKHGGGVSHQDSNLDDLAGPETRDPLEVLAVHEALDQLAEKAPRKAELVKLRYFLGCTMAEAAQVLGIAQATAEEDWTYSKAWLRRQWLRGEQKKDAPG
jgi:RNA polymerase sigma factor (TIGR02999 family)